MSDFAPGTCSKCGGPVERRRLHPPVPDGMPKGRSADLVLPWCETDGWVNTVLSPAGSPPPLPYGRR